MRRSQFSNCLSSWFVATWLRRTSRLFATSGCATRRTARPGTSPTTCADGEFASGGGAWQQQQRGGGWDAEARARRATEREARRASLRTLSVLELMMHPRMLLLVGAAALGYYAVFAPQQRPTIHRGNETVNAWWNDKKSRWETPAPWDTAFQKLAPPLQQVPKHQVFRNAPPPT